MHIFFFSSRRRHTRWNCDWSSDVCSSDLVGDASVRNFERDHRETGVRSAKRPLHAEYVRAVEIGRASCRERESISGVGGTLVKYLGLSNFVRSSNVSIVIVFTMSEVAYIH